MPKCGYAVLLMLLCCFSFFCNVNKDPVKSEQAADASIYYLEFTDYGCSGNELKLGKAAESGVYLKNYFFNKDTLTLRIHYTANCCPGFVDSVSVTGNEVGIALADTLRGCRCICDYDNDFSFLYNDTGELRIIFKWWDITHTQLVTAMDTTLIVTRQGS